MKIILTESQAHTIITALEWTQNADFPDWNQQCQRIINKINKEFQKKVEKESKK